MEPITHLLTGACLARAGFNRKTALATTVMVLAAEAPDLDIVAYFGGSVTGFQHHRGITHTLAGVPLIAAAVVGFVWLLHRWRVQRGWQPKASSPPLRWPLLYLFACLAALSHILLDFTNQYGVRPFEPFSYQWYAWDIVAIVEPALLALLAAGLLLPLLFRLINEEVGARTKGPHGRAGAIVALLLVVAVWWFRDLQHRRALANLQSQTYLGAEPVRASAYPYMTDPFTWYGVVETETFFGSMHVDSRTGEVDRERRMRVRYKPQETPVTLAAKSSPMGRVYLDWAAYPYVEVEKLAPPESGYLVHLYDLRYTYPEENVGVLGATVELDDRLAVRRQGMGRRALQPAD
ncbi:MAG: metal-dependent hydrolase [Candidatus Koribacter versatilis]|uniref:Metal-dependent hydrolase n=1 Tax=Candidatus Korobacter versatilis TaxID=658062 RepID=A0A932A894_9BACT|nr:metal-dependent hydrolase [Candidatus Koribacter versatilis]